jgi:hypothetical protein
VTTRVTLIRPALVIDFPESPSPDNPRFAQGRFYDVKLLEDAPVTQLGDSVPQEGLRPVGPSPTRSIGERVKGGLAGALTGAREGFRKTTR